MTTPTKPTIAGLKLDLKAHETRIAEQAHVIKVLSAGIKRLTGRLSRSEKARAKSNDIIERLLAAGFTHWNSHPELRREAQEAIGKAEAQRDGEP